MQISLWKLWEAYGSGRRSGRVECPITLYDGREATHIYRGYGTIRLERISDVVANKKGFQGEELASSPELRSDRMLVKIVD